jgi:hypothetical protein
MENPAMMIMATAHLVVTLASNHHCVMINVTQANGGLTASHPVEPVLIRKPVMSLLANALVDVALVTLENTVIFHVMQENGAKVVRLSVAIVNTPWAMELADHVMVTACMGAKVDLDYQNAQAVLKAFMVTLV